MELKKQEMPLPVSHNDRPPPSSRLQTKLHFQGGRKNSITFFFFIYSLQTVVTIHPLTGSHLDQLTKISINSSNVTNRY